MIEWRSFMKGKKRLFSVIIALFIIIGFVWWYSPVSLMTNVNPEDVSCIEVTGGNSGGVFLITDTDTIVSIVTNIQNTPLKKSKVSIMYSGALYDLSFKDPQGNKVYNLIVNDGSTIRKDPFFYHDSTESICFDLLEKLEVTARVE